MPNSNLKGKTGEREFAALLRQFGIDARRGVQYSGGKDSPDVVSVLENVHWEVKRTEKIRVLPWLNKAYEDSFVAGDQVIPCDCESYAPIPVVSWRKNRGPWVSFLYTEDLLQLLIELEEFKNREICIPVTKEATRG